MTFPVDNVREALVIQSRKKGSQTKTSNACLPIPVHGRRLRVCKSINENIPIRSTVHSPLQRRYQFPIVSQVYARHPFDSHNRVLAITYPNVSRSVLEASVPHIISFHTLSEKKQRGVLRRMEVNRQWTMVIIHFVFTGRMGHR